MPRGTHPNSLANLIAGKNKKRGTKPTLLSLSEIARKNLKKSGNMSDQIEKIFGESAENYILCSKNLISDCEEILEKILMNNKANISEIYDEIEILLSKIKKLIDDN